MAAGKSEESALGSAHSRFVESLPRKAIELRGAIALLTATPAAEGPREDMRRRLHTLYASAVVFRNEPLSQAVREGIERLDAARDEARALDTSDLSLLAQLVRRIPELRGEYSDASVASGSEAPPAPASPSLAPAKPVTPLDFVVTRPPPKGPSSAAPRTSVLPVPEKRETPPGGEARPSLPQEVEEFGGRTSSAPTPPEAEAPLSLAASERRPLLQRVLSVLVLAGPGERKPLGELLRSECLALTFVDTARQALESVRDSAPDVVLADEGLAVAGTLLEGLRMDPLTDFVPVVFLAALAGPESSGRTSGRPEVPDARLSRPFESSLLLRTLGRVTGTLVETSTGLVALGEATVGEVAERVADEIRRGLVDAIELGREARIPLGEGAEVLAAAWAAVARVRAFVSEQSAGRVRFREMPSRTSPALLSMGQRSEQTALAVQATPNGELGGRRILVVDDDPQVIEFFSAILLEHGATVASASTGADALLAARRERPDLIISDVLMPDLDGFALCRKLKRDPVLADVPVVLISWREELLSRLREVSAGASGYLKKEASWEQVLSTVREALSARATLEQLLGGAGEVRGNLEGTGVVSLLRSVRRTRPDARVTLRDAWNLFECELREGRLAQLTRTASDGSFVRGEAALPQLLGAVAGRYTVTVARGSLKHSFEGSLDQVLTRGARELGAQLDALSFPLLGRVARIVFDEDAYPALINQSPAVMRQVVERLHAGEAPLKLTPRGDIAQATLEAILLDMGRRGAIRGVVGSAGEDLFAEARTLRGHERAVELSTPLSIFPESNLELEESDAGSALQPAPSPLAASPNVEVDTSLPVEVRAIASDEGALAASPERGTEVHLEVPEQSARRSTPHPAPAPLERRDSSMFGSRADPPASTPPASVTPVASPSGKPTPHASPAAALVASPASTSAEVLRPSDARASQPGAATARERPEAGTSSDRRAALPPSTPNLETDPSAAEVRRSRSTLAAWAVALLALFAAAFFAERMLEPQDATQIEVIGGKRASAPSGDTKGDAPAPDVPPQPASTPKPLAPTGALVVPQDSGFEIYNGILEPGLVTAPDQGLLVVEASNQLQGAELSVDQQPRGPVPAKVALSEGIHELAIRRGDAVSYRFVSVRPGKTWVLRSL